MKYIIVLPYAYGPYVTECLETLDVNLIENCVAIDNTGAGGHENFGVAGSWNLGIDRLREVDGDWLVVMSAAMRFRDGGQSMIDQLVNHPEAQVVHFAQKYVPKQQFIRGKSLGYNEGNLQWHLTAIRRDVIDTVGYFDPNLYPCYFEDLDYDLRINKAYPNVNWQILPIDAHGKSLGHAVELGGIVSPAEPLIAYMATKWGTHPSAIAKLGTYNRPFDDDNNSLAFFPPAHGRTWDA